MPYQNGGTETYNIMMETKILVIEDDEAVAQSIQAFFEDDGYEVKVSSDGSEGVNLFKMYDPDITILDITLPKKDGWQVCREIRENSQKPIIMISTKGDVFDKVLGLELGADDYMFKPIDNKELSARIKAVLRRYRSALPKSDDEVIRFPHWHGESPFDTTEPEEPFIHMAGQETFKFAVSSITRDVKLLLERNSLTADDIKYIVPHQANARIIDTAARRLKIPQEKFYLNIDRLGNTSSASIPIALDELARSGKLERGDKLIFSAFGGGLSAAAALLVW